MTNIFDKIIEYIKKDEEKAISIFSIIGCIIALIVVLVMWVSSFISLREGKINKYIPANYTRYALDNYASQLPGLLRTSNADNLFKRLNIDYVADNNIDDGNYKKFFLENNFIGNAIEVVSSNVLYQSGNLVVYRFEYKNYNEFKYINIIETRPFEYTISFNDYSELYQLNDTYRGNSEKVSYEVSLVNYDSNSVRYLIRLENLNPENLYINFNDLNTFTLIMATERVPLNSVVAQNINEIVTNGTVARELNFTLPKDKTILDIQGISINNVKIGEKETSINIEF